MQLLLADGRANGAYGTVPPESQGRPRVDEMRLLSEVIFKSRNGLRCNGAYTEDGPPDTLSNR
jgi:hypothetical protein